MTPRKDFRYYSGSAVEAAQQQRAGLTHDGPLLCESEIAASAKSSKSDVAVAYAFGFARLWCAARNWTGRTWADGAKERADFWADSWCRRMTIFFGIALLVAIVFTAFEQVAIMGGGK